ncbi:8-oxo-dGTP pyrophosphatase MutT (NUDIX family) [Alkalibacillus flavidus]|uniref:8-oxo-dGTP pyrophosphatase MutT (NUDIX family) n=1 Tax=Alkalibacillus flavidus TaxID=546021 RepID=A0ABV2KTF7_9BACI
MNSDQIHHILKHHQPQSLGQYKPKETAVLLPLIQKEDGLHILFEVRSLSMRRQPGEVCFPGGQVDDEDDDANEAALRELHEELGVSKEQVDYTQSLGWLQTPFGLKVHAYVGLLKTPSTSSFTLNPDEVADVFTVPLAHFLQNGPTIHYMNMAIEPDDSFPLHHVPNQKMYTKQSFQIEEHFYYFEDRVIWGLTARILKDFIHILAENT